MTRGPVRAKLAAAMNLHVATISESARPAGNSVRIVVTVRAGLARPASQIETSIRGGGRSLAFGSKRG
jgi:hypothetical protein